MTKFRTLHYWLAAALVFQSFAPVIAQTIVTQQIPGQTMLCTSTGYVMVSLRVETDTEHAPHAQTMACPWCLLADQSAMSAPQAVVFTDFIHLGYGKLHIAAQPLLLGEAVALAVEVRAPPVVSLSS